jgi:hypothetical protein
VNADDFADLLEGLLKRNGIKVAPDPEDDGTFITLVVTDTDGDEHAVMLECDEPGPEDDDDPDDEEEDD